MRSAAMILLTTSTSDAARGVVTIGAPLRDVRLSHPHTDEKQDGATGTSLVRSAGRVVPARLVHLRVVARRHRSPYVQACQPLTPPPAARRAPLEDER
jgi:hypothetical protein